MNKDAEKIGFLKHVPGYADFPKNAPIQGFNQLIIAIQLFITGVVDNTYFCKLIIAIHYWSC